MLKTNFKEYLAFPTICAIVWGIVFADWWWVFGLGYLTFFIVYVVINFRAIKGLSKK